MGLPDLYPHPAFMYAGTDVPVRPADDRAGLDRIGADHAADDSAGTGRSGRKAGAGERQPQGKHPRLTDAAALHL